LDFVNFGGFCGFRFLDPPLFTQISLIVAGKMRLVSYTGRQRQGLRVRRLCFTP